MQDKKVDTNEKRFHDKAIWWEKYVKSNPEFVKNEKKLRRACFYLAKAEVMEDVAAATSLMGTIEILKAKKRAILKEMNISRANRVKYFGCR